MRKFESREIRDAEEYARSGGQALHIFNRGGEFDHLTKISVFLRNHPWAHLFDQDKARLVKTARKLGVRQIVIDREDRDGQHVDLCGKPLDRALALCEPVQVKRKGIRDMKR